MFTCNVTRHFVSRILGIPNPNIPADHQPFRQWAEAVNRSAYINDELDLGSIMKCIWSMDAVHTKDLYLVGIKNRGHPM